VRLFLFFMDIRFTMQRLLRAYGYVNILSLDIAVGAVVSALFFSKILQVRILPYGLLALALTVWIIYTADHLLDARSINRAASSERHRFHQRHFTLLSWLLVIALLVNLFIILYTRKPVLRWGINLASIVFVYLVVQHYLKILKEFLIAILYTAGVLLPSWSVTAVTIGGLHYLLFAQFASVAFINLLIFSWCDYESDLADEQRSFATTVGKDVTVKVINVLAVLVLALAFYFIAIDFFPAAATIIATVGLLHLLVLLLCRKKLLRNNSYRIFADATFFLPSLYLLWDLR
jgi:hypothetical protein